MASFNRVILMGNLTRDIELRYTPSGTAVTDAGVAVNDRRKNGNGEWIDEVTFVDVTLWGRTAEVASEYLEKGSPIFLEGRLKLDSWEKDGQKHSKLRVVCDRMQLIGGGANRGSGGSTSPPEVSQKTAAPPSEARYSPPVDPPQQQPPSQENAPPTGGDSGYDGAEIPF